VLYMLGQWRKLLPFLEHPDIPLDTNRVKNAMRPFVIARRDRFLSQTTAGVTARARLYSLVETARPNGI